MVSKTAQLPGIFKPIEPIGTSISSFAETWLNVIGVKLPEEMEYIVDSCPIILAKGPRSEQGKVAGELCEKSYNSSRKEWYYGIKLHAVVALRPGHLPVPLSLMASGAAQHTLPSARQISRSCETISPLGLESCMLIRPMLTLAGQNH